MSSLNGGGGAERFFSDFYEKYFSYQDSKFNVFLFTDSHSVKELNKVGRLNQINSNIIILKTYSNRFKKQLENFNIIFNVIKYNIHLFHCANYNRFDFEKISYLKYNIFTKVKIVQNIVDCKIPHILDNKSDPSYEGYYKTYVTHLKKIKFDGILSWYKLYVDFFKKNNWFLPSCEVQNITSRYADYKKFIPSRFKSKTIVFASRLDKQKNPSWFIEAVKILNDESLLENSKWKFLIYGEGPLKEELKNLVKRFNINHLLKFKNCSNLEEIFPFTTCYVSTQDYENFPSLSMMEAMASGNVIIARDVGQTDLLLNDDINGIIMKQDSPKGLSLALKKLMSLDDRQLNKMMTNGTKLIKEVHNEINFFNQIENFWTQVLKNRY